MILARPLNICLCTADFIGPVRNGGIGTAYHALAMALRDAGHRVTVLYALGDWCENGYIWQWVDHYEKIGIDFVPVPPVADRLSDCCPFVRTSYECYLWLADQEKKGRIFDIIHFHEWRGIGFHSTLAKRQGLNFAKSVICLGTHSPHQWHQLGMHQFPSELYDLQADFIERSSVQLADALVSPSHYMVDWMRGQGWKLPDDVQIIQNILADYTDLPPMPPPAPVTEIVFFGRLEMRKGMILFCDAMEKLFTDASWLKKNQNLSITFLGKPVNHNGESSDIYLRARCGNWPISFRIVEDLDHDGALAFLKQRGRLAIMPSLLDNLPYTVMECLGGGVSFLCTDLPGNREMIAEQDRQRVMFVPRPSELAAKIVATLEHGSQPAGFAIDPHQTQQQWLDWHHQAAAALRPAPPLSEKPLVSVCLVTRNRHNLLSQALDSLRDQDYPNLQVVLVDDGSDKPESIAFLDALESEFAQKSWKIVRQPNKYLGAARNAGAQASDGEWLLFMDDDNVAITDEISTFVRAAQFSGADVLTCFAARFIGNDAPQSGVTDRELWLPLGGAVAVGVFCNQYGDANGLVRREVFNKLGGFTEDFGIGHEDWELYAKAALSGHVVQVVPKPLFWYRVHPTSMLQTTNDCANRLRSLRPYAQSIGHDLSQALLMAQAMHFSPKSFPLPFSPTAPAESQNGDPQKLVDEYWDSLSWRLTLPGRAAFGVMSNLPLPPRPRVKSYREAMIAIQDIRRSISWEATGPLRVAGRAIHKILHYGNGHTPNQPRIK